MLLAAVDSADFAFAATLIALYLPTMHYLAASGSRSPRMMRDIFMLTLKRLKH